MDPPHYWHIRWPPESALAKYLKALPARLNRPTYFPVSVLATLATTSAGMAKPMFSAPVEPGGR
jgi:hypothetical protein